MKRLLSTALFLLSASTVVADIPPPTPPTRPVPPTAPSLPAEPAPQPVAQARTEPRPPPVPSPELSSPETEQEDDDSGWGVVYLQLQGGISHANMLQFSDENFIPEAEELRGTGAFGGLALGFRVYWLTIGAYGTLARQGDFDLGTVGLEAAFHIPIPVVSPYVRVGVGYTWVGQTNFSDARLSETNIFGLSIEAGAGIDIQLTSVLSLGAGFDAVFLNLTRQSLGSTEIGNVMLEEDGDALGFQLRAHGHLTIHI